MHLLQLVHAPCLAAWRQAYMLSINKRSLLKEEAWQFLSFMQAPLVLGARMKELPAPSLIW